MSMPPYRLNDHRGVIHESYEEYCPICNGFKILARENFYEVCTTCNGSGIINWIDKIKLKKENNNEKNKDITNRG